MGVAPIFALTILLVSTANALPRTVEDDQQPEAARMDSSPFRKVFRGMGKTFALSEGTLATFDEARTFCQDQGGDMATMPSYKEFDLVTSHLTRDDYDVHAVGGQYIRVGAKRSGEDTSSSGKKTDVYWITGEPIPVNFARWYKSEPDNQMSMALESPFHDGSKGGKDLRSVDFTHGPYRVLCEI